jgi:hypothetical protein
LKVDSCGNHRCKGTEKRKRKKEVRLKYLKKKRNTGEKHTRHCKT